MSRIPTTAGKFAVALALIVFASESSLRADSIELINGDLLHGKVVSLDDRELRLVSDIHGAVIIDREKVAAIGLGDRRLAPPVAGAAVAPGEVQAIVRRGAEVNVNGRPTVTATVPVAPIAAQDVLRQLRAQGLSAENVAELQKALPMLKEPGAKRYFDDTVNDLVEGKIDVETVRKDAIRARNEYRKTAKSLGPDGEKTLNQALGGYLQILDRFIEDTDPKSAGNNRAPAAPADSGKNDSSKSDTAKNNTAKNDTTKNDTAKKESKEANQDAKEDAKNSANATREAPTNPSPVQPEKNERGR